MQFQSDPALKVKWETEGISKFLLQNFFQEAIRDDSNILFKVKFLFRRVQNIWLWRRLKKVRILSYSDVFAILRRHNSAERASLALNLLFLRSQKYFKRARDKKE